MSIKDQLINDIKMLPDHTVYAISIVVKEFIELNKLNNKTVSKPKPVYGSGKGKMWIADDFDAPLEELDVQQIWEI